MVGRALHFDWTIPVVDSFLWRGAKLGAHRKLRAGADATHGFNRSKAVLLRRSRVCAGKLLGDFLVLNGLVERGGFFIRHAVGVTTSPATTRSARHPVVVPGLGVDERDLSLEFALLHVELLLLRELPRLPAAFVLSGVRLVLEVRHHLIGVGVHELVHHCAVDLRLEVLRVQRLELRHTLLTTSKNTQRPTHAGQVAIAVLLGSVAQQCEVALVVGVVQCGAVRLQFVDHRLPLRADTLDPLGFLHLEVELLLLSLVCRISALLLALAVHLVRVRPEGDAEVVHALPPLPPLRLP